MKVRRLICAVAILCCASAIAFADGTVFVQGIAKPRIPDQSALITFDGKTERLVIETAIEGEGTEFAWVVPVPSMPKVEAATPGLFPTLRAITSPRLVGYSSDWPGLPILGILAGILIWWGIESGRWTGPVVTFVILAVLLSGFVFSAFRSAGPIPSPMMSGGINVLDRKIVGLYETVTISGTDGKNISDWLNSNGFKVARDRQAALTQYAKEGWVFVAGRFRRESAEAGQFRAHPLSFTFATSRAVYPMRLTGIENGPVALDLYAVGNEEAVAAPFVRQRAGRLDFDANKDRDDFIPLSHEALQSYCRGFFALTALSATLSPEQMKDDLYLTWKPLTPFRPVYYMRQTALAWASPIAAGVFVLLSIVCAVKYCRPYRHGRTAGWKRDVAGAAILLSSVGVIGAGILAFVFMFDESLIKTFIALMVMAGALAVLTMTARRLNVFEQQARESGQSEMAPLPKPPLQIIMIVFLAPALLGACVYLALPKTPTQVLRVHWRRAVADHREILEGLNEMKPAGDPAATLAAYRKEAASIIAGWRKEYPESDEGKNDLSGLPFVEEDSPGNYIIELKDGKPTYFHFDEAGRKIKLGVIGEVRSKSDE
ncbi:MAG: DUF2330 domain-containing protein [Candidatus Brocadiia bacterium]|jgi:hypothetical protein